MSNEDIPDGCTKREKVEKSFVMNRLILIGNGFDLAHGMKTGYYDFIFTYIKESFVFAEENGKYSDDLITINRQFSGGRKVETFSKLEDFLQFKQGKGVNEAAIGYFFERQAGHENAHEIFRFQIHSPFLEDLLDHCGQFRWVDIENKYYQHLTKLIESNDKVEKKLNDLNLAFNSIIAKLKGYLKTQRSEGTIDDINRIFTEKIRKDDLVTVLVDDDEIPENITIVNFNYTDTVDLYRKTPEYTYYKKKIRIIHIHGELANDKNPIIFGFGDELDERYKELEAEKRKGFLNFMKSFWYFKTRNYHDLIRFIKSGDYQVYIMGHSCGLSDRTMLHMIFEHENCKSIKIFPYVSSDHDNYTELTQEISRHFKDKGVMRMKIVNRGDSDPMPQLKL